MANDIAAEPLEPRPACEDHSRQAGAQTASLGEKLGAMADGLPPGAVTLTTIRDMVGQDGLLVLTVFLTIVFMVPVSIPGVSTVFGAAILLIAVSRLLNRNLWLPRRIASHRLPADSLRTAFLRGARWLRALECVSRPRRLDWMVSARPAPLVNDCALIAGALLLMAPFGLIPFSNTLPALALLFLAIGLLQRDGLCILYGHLLNLVTVAYFALLLLGGGLAVREAFRRLFGGAA